MNMNETESRTEGMLQLQLNYEKELYEDLEPQGNSQLTVFAKGIPTENVITKLFHSYASHDHLVFILSTTSPEEKYFMERVQGEGRQIMSITADVPASERKEKYLEGGVFFITSRIMIVDLLKEVIPIEKMTGVVVFRAHNVIESSQEAFILRLYRSKNKTGFIKAFSYTAASFLMGFSQLNRVMRCTFLANVSLWPRYHASIKESLSVVDKGKDISGSRVIEVDLRLTEEMREIQSNLMDLITLSISELKRLVPALNDEDITVDTALTKGFEKTVAAYLDPVWNTINSKSKEILSEIKIFRLLLVHLTKSDCVTFYGTLCNFTSQDAALRYSWILTKSAENIIIAARKRIFSHNMGPSSSSSGSTDKSSCRTFKPEIYPKWAGLQELLQDIAIKKEKDGGDQIFKKNATDKPKIIIYTEDVFTGKVLRDYLCLGSDAALAKQIRNNKRIKIDLPEKLRKLLDDIEDGNEQDSEEIKITLTQVERKYLDVEFLQVPVFIRPMKFPEEGSNAFEVSETLSKLEPDVVIIFDPNLELVRNVEVYRARMAETKLVDVYFLSFRNSVEEQIYLTSLHREKIAFEMLIRDKATMVVPEEREAKDELNQDLWRDPTKANETVSTSGLSRRNMESENNVQHVILVDIREFRSELPSLLHKRGIDLDPVTLDVGDYILTPDICVERKSISDLIGSLNSGRLYKQAEAMIRHYKKPILLIEHEQTQNTRSASRSRNELAQIMPKLQLLTIHFPKLKPVWSPGAHYTSELFHELKRGKEQPNTNTALAILKEESGISLSQYNSIAHTFLSKMPGLDARNIYRALNRCNSLPDLIKLSKEELSEVLEGSSAAAALYSGLRLKGTSSEGCEGFPSLKSKGSNSGALSTSSPSIRENNKKRRLRK